MSLFSASDSVSHHLPTFAREVFDVTGAGDTVIATIALARAGGATMEESAVIANHAAGHCGWKSGNRNSEPVGTAVRFRIPQCAFCRLVRQTPLRWRRNTRPSISRSAARDAATRRRRRPAQRAAESGLSLFLF